MVREGVHGSSPADGFIGAPRYSRDGPRVRRKERRVEDPVEIRRRIEALVTRVARRDDYGQLLARGDVVRRLEDVSDPEAWRAEIKRQARADRIKVRTGKTERVVYALLPEAWTPTREAESDRYLEIMSATIPRAVGHRHEPAFVLRDADEVVCKCERCPALGFADAATGLIGGELFEDDCPHDSPPSPTPLALHYVGPGDLS
jgi:hypothetical protein